MREPKLRDQIQSVRQILADTRKGELRWTETGERESYKAIRQHDGAQLERDDDGMLVIRFMTDDRPDWAVTIRQLGGDAEPTIDEDARDGLLLLLWDAVEKQLGPEHTDSMLRFAGRNLAESDEAKGV